MIIFKDSDHSYLNTDTNEKYCSVTTLVGKYKTPFDTEYWSKYKAIEALLPNFRFFLKLYRRDLHKLEHKLLSTSEEESYGLDILQTYKEKVLWFQQSWQKEKELGCEKGTAYHDFKEQDSYIRRLELNPFTNSIYTVFERPVNKILGIDNQSLLDNLYHLKDGVYPELLIWNHFFKIAGQSDRVFIETINNIRWIDIDDYKGLALDTPIATINGWKLIKDIEINDTIFDGKGHPTKVKNVSEIHYNPCYKITFDTNDEIICDHEHKWILNYKKSKGNFLEKEYTTEEIYNNFFKFKLKHIPRIECTNLKLQDSILPIDPYILGVWLGDGNSCCGTITNLNINTWKEIKKRGYKISHNLSSTLEDKIDKAETRTIYGLYTQLKKLKLLQNKHIPDIYLRASHSQRLDLLRGFMDADGHLNRSRKRCVMVTTKIWQCEALSTLVSSLGFKPTIIPATTSGFGKINIPTWHITFTPTENPFLSRNKDYFKVIGSEIGKYSKYRIIKSIEKINTVPTKCLEVDSPDHTYLAGKNFIKTHNTNKKIKSTGYNKMQFPLENLSDCEISHYSLQLSTYAYMLEEMGFKIRNLGLSHYDTPIKLEYIKQDAKKMLNHYHLRSSK